MIMVLVVLAYTSTGLCCSALLGLLMTRDRLTLQANAQAVAKQEQANEIWWCDMRGSWLLACCVQDAICHGSCMHAALAAPCR
jgi:hypothetical protein